MDMFLKISVPQANFLQAVRFGKNNLSLEGMCKFGVSEGI